jgi:curved DNA-binding protein
MEYKDYYKIMALEKNATQAEIKKVYRKLARKYHPDVSKEADAEQKFKEVGEAYEVLKDPEKRASYDQLGANWQSGQDFNPPPGWDAGYEFSGAGRGGFSGSDSASFSDFFESLFGQNSAGFNSYQADGRRNAHSGYSQKGEDHHAKVLIDIEDAFNGAVREISLQSPKVDAQGHLSIKKRTLKVKIPKGVKQGQQIRLTGQGQPSPTGSTNGDLYLELEFKTHDYYSAEGHDLYLKLPVAPWEAALGAKIKIPTPSGIIELKIPAGSVSGNKLRLKGRGLPAKSPGDLYAVLQISLPPADNQKAKEFYQKMAQQLAFNPRAKLEV